MSKITFLDNIPGFRGGIYRLDIHGFWHPASGMRICVFLFILLSGEEIFGCAFVYFII